VRGVGIDTAWGVDPKQTKVALGRLNVIREQKINFEEACHRSPWRLGRSHEPVVIGRRILETILQLERFRIDFFESAFTGRTA
jgi:hypothetical protein